MENPTPYEACHEPLDDEERELMNSETWDWEHPVDALVSKDLRVSFPIALTREEHTDIANAARLAELSTPAFIKRAALQIARANTEESARRG
jgi:hypothetical protein